MKVTLDQIKQLRNETKAGVMDARKALMESGGDMAMAKQWLTKQGLKKAAKKAGRETSEGLIEAYIHAGARVGAIVKLSCETDFVAKTEEFKTLAREVAMQVASMSPKNIKELSKQAYIRDSRKTIADLLKEAIAKLGENVKVEKIERMEVGKS